MPSTALGSPIDRRATMANFDLKLLAVIGELHRTRSVSQAAERLGLSQSAVSMSLAKLRKHFNDALFVRTSTGMEPTPHASQLIGILSQAEDLLQAAFGRSVVFDAATSNRLFHIQSTDIAQVTLIPKLMQHLRKAAPNLRIDLQRIGPSTPRLLESGELDLAIGFIHPMGAGFCQQRLFKERFVCAMRSDHPRIGHTLTAKAFENESHLAIATSGTGHNIVEKILETQKIRRNVSLTVPSFLGIATIISSSDHLVILPEQLGRHLAGPGNIKVLPLPFDIPAYYIMQHWHERYSQDPASQWLRTVISDLFKAPRGYQLH
ncbi:MAG: LysR family transcriptional regulator [Bryobacterales bacterium]|nr:LysR family transcriptional regulator [Bryobacterales bacterium]MBV9396794.1 LysR family transcriptional regulator [Bryobacterales bacterium]